MESVDSVVIIAAVAALIVVAIGIVLAVFAFYVVLVCAGVIAIGVDQGAEQQMSAPPAPAHSQ